MNHLTHQQISTFLRQVLSSTLITLLIFWLTYYFWYDNNLLKLSGINILFNFFVVINIIIFPFIYALVIKEDKREQRRDHTIIRILQIVLISFVLYFLANHKIAWISYSVDYFDIIRKKDIVYSIEDPNESIPATWILSRYSWVGSSFSDNEALSARQRTEDLSGVILARRVDGLVPIAEKQELMQKYAQSLDALLTFNSQEEVARIREQYPQATQWLGIKGFVRDGVVLTDQNFSFFEIVLLQPWEDISLGDDAD